MRALPFQELSSQVFVSTFHSSILLVRRETIAPATVTDICPIENTMPGRDGF
jgi:hypothetical protein